MRILGGPEGEHVCVDLGRGDDAVRHDRRAVERQRANIGVVTIFKLASVSPASVSAKPKSPAMKAYGLSSNVVTVMWNAVDGKLDVDGAHRNLETARPGDAVTVNHFPELTVVPVGVPVVTFSVST